MAVPLTLAQMVQNPITTYTAAAVAAMRIPLDPNNPGQGTFANLKDDQIVFDPRHNSDRFEKVTASKAEMRGNEDYLPPYGWKQRGLSIEGKKFDQAAPTWLERNGKGSWPVAYHGTKSFALEPILNGKLQAGKNNWYGEGIYCTPNIKEAQVYCDKFVFQGQEYFFVFKCRVNPKDRVFCEEKLNHHGHKGPEDYWYMTNPDSIRYYKLCIKPVK